MEILGFVICAFFSTHAIAETRSYFPTLPPPRNPFHIFNVIHSSMRQWGSSLNHNGMSFFPALVPEGTELYHGRGGNETVTGMEWLAFEPEHAELFAWRRFRPPPPGNRTRKPPPDEGQQQVLNSVPSDDPIEPEMGFLHTYVSKKDLRLLYIDGMSAGKTNNGTLDSQDYILLNSTHGHSAFWDYERALRICKIAQDDWEGRIDGFLRMEAGFEIVLCNFSKHLNVRRITRAGGLCPIYGGCGPENAVSANFAYLRAVADRYQGIGGNRVRINYDNFVTAYSYDVDLFEKSNRAPRLRDVPARTLNAMRADLDKLIFTEPDPWSDTGTDWQAVVDMIVTRYSGRLKYLGMPDIVTDERKFHHELELMFSMFIDYDHRDYNEETDRCAAHFIPTSAKPSLAAQVVSYVSDYICWLLVLAQMSTVGDRVPERVINQLVNALNWTTWKDCGPCGYDEVCVVPIWPYGVEKDWESPECTNATQLASKRGYWGHGRPPPRKERPENDLIFEGDEGQRLGFWG